MCRETGNMRTYTPLVASRQCSRALQTSVVQRKEKKGTRSQNLHAASRQSPVLEESRKISGTKEEKKEGRKEMERKQSDIQTKRCRYP